MHPAASPWDVVVVGGGPAGSTAAAILAQHGRRVLLLEKERFPRYHVGESLMPHCFFPLERLGLVEQVRAAGYPKKYSVQFVRTSGEVSAPFYFFQHRDHPSSITWQVPRAHFDQLLLDNARRSGVEVLEGCPVTSLIEAGGVFVGVRARVDGVEKSIAAQLTIDATGRDALAAVRSGWRVRDPRLDKVAIWTYYRGALRDPGLDEGATTVAYLPRKGWLWYIPLPDDLVSVGVVADRSWLFREGRDPAAIFEREAATNPWIARHLAPGSRAGRHFVTGEFSYRSRHCAADGLVLAGDAFAFLDPVFSSGVFLALKSGEMAADAAHAALLDSDVSAGRFERYGRTLCAGIENMRRLVYAFYDESFSFRKVTERGLRGELTDCLIGDLFRDYAKLFDGVADLAALPEPLLHGGPRLREPTAAASG